MKFARGDFGNSMLLGDSGYSNTTYLMTPYIEPRSATEVSIYKALVWNMKQNYFENCRRDSTDLTKVLGVQLRELLVCWKKGSMFWIPTFEWVQQKQLGKKIYISSRWSIICPYLFIRITVACCVLHNIAIDRNQPLDMDNWEEFMENDVQAEMITLQSSTSEAVMRRLGNEKRDRIAKNTFTM